MKIYNNPVLIRTNTYPKRNEAKQVQYSPSFKSDPGTFVALYLLRTAGKKINSTRKLNAFKETLSRALQAPQKCKKSIPGLLDKLAKASNKIEYSIFYNYSGYKSLSYYKKKALTELLPVMDDEYLGYRVAKKNYLTELAKSDEFIDQDFVDALGALPDSYYQNFKLELIEKLLSSADGKNAYIFRMLKGLDNDDEMNKNCLQRNKVYINRLREKMFNNMYSTATVGLDGFYYTYSNVDNVKKKPAFLEFDTLFYSLAKDIKSLDKFKEVFKLGTNAASDIIKDLNTIASAKRNPNKAEKLVLYKKRLQEKFDTNVIGEYDKTFPGECESDRLREELRRLECKYSNITDFIKKTDSPDELNSAFKEKLDAMKEHIKWLEEYYQDVTKHEDDDRDSSLALMMGGRV